MWLGHRSDEEAARLILMRRRRASSRSSGPPFNDTALPYRILKYARLGRRTIAPDLPGCDLGARGGACAGRVRVGGGAALVRGSARPRPDLELRQWATSQTAFRVNGPLWDRLERLGVALGR